MAKYTKLVDFRRAATTAGFALLALFVVTGVVLGLSIANRVDINENDGDIADLNDDTKFLLRDVFYVCGNGSDKNPGTQKKPWLTIKHAAQQLRIKKGVELHICNGTFDVNSTDFIFSFVEIYGTTEVTADLNITSAENLGYGKYRLNVTNTLIPGTLANMYVESNELQAPAIVYDNGADYVIMMGRPGSTSSLTTYGASVLNRLTMVNIHSDTSFNYVNGSSAFFKALILNMNGTVVVSSRPLDVWFQGCAFMCNDGIMQLTRTGNYQVIGSHFFECDIKTEKASVSITRCIVEDGKFDASGGQGVIGNTIMNKRCQLQYAATYTFTGVTIEVDDSLAMSIYSASDVVLRDTSITSYVAIALYVVSGKVDVGSTVLSNNVTNSIMFLNEGSEAHIAGIHMIRTNAIDGRMIDSRKSVLFFQGTDYLFRGFTSAILYAEQTTVVMDNGFFIGNQTIDGAGIGHMITFTGGSEVNAEDITIELTNLTNPGVLFENSRATFSAGTITLETGSSVGVEIAGVSHVVLGEGVTLDINTSSSNPTNSPVYVQESSTLLLKGTSDLSNDAGTCVYATHDSKVIHAAGADITLFCGLKEFQLHWDSTLLFSNDSDATLSLGTADNTTLGGDYNATTFYLGTPDTSYTDGIGAGLEGCKIMYTAD